MTHEIMDFNVGMARGKKVVVISKCIEDRYPDIVQGYLEKGYLVLTACPEKTHINMIGYKLISIVSYSHLNFLEVLTVDGSYHCIQLQHLVRDIKKHFFDIETKHMVLEKGKIYQISGESVDASRHLHKVEKLQKSCRKMDG